MSAVQAAAGASGDELAKLRTAAGAEAGTVKVNPVLVGVGVGYRF